MKSIYIVFSATPFKMGSFIRFFTHEKYNHVSLALDSNFSEVYCFARHYIDTPFYGGLVKDSPSRYRHNGRIADIAVAELKLDENKYDAFAEQIKNMYAHRADYIYNTVSAICALFKHKVIKRDSYTCVEFAAMMLATVDGRVDADSFYSVMSLMRIFEKETVYEGKFDFSASDGTDYLTKQGFRAAIAKTLSNFTELIRR